MIMPKFFTSEYFVPEPDNWHLKEDAPPELVKEFEEWMKEHNQPDKMVDQKGSCHEVIQEESQETETGRNQCNQQ